MSDFFYTLQREVTLNYYWVTFWRKNADCRLCPPMAYDNVTLIIINYWAWVRVKLKSCLEIAMPFVANDSLNTSQHVVQVSVWSYGNIRPYNWSWLLFGHPKSLRMECIWQATRNPGQSKFYGKNGVLPGRILRDQISEIFLSRRDIWHVWIIETHIQQNESKIHMVDLILHVSGIY